MKAVFACGRFNPPTVGHQALVDEVKRLAVDGRNGTIFTTRSHDRDRNPLAPDIKAAFIERAFGLPVRLCSTPFEALGFLVEDGADDIIFVVGEDRAERFTALHCQVHVVTRRSDAPSATDAREAAAWGDRGTFDRLVPSPDPTFADDLWAALRTAA